MKVRGSFFIAGLLILLLASGLMAQSELKKISLESGWQFSQAGKDDWAGAKVPGCVHTDLLANEKIDDPFWRDNEQKLQWIGKTDWQYRKTFQLKEESLQRNIDLVFEGLDTYAEVFLNGKKILSADNMFRKWRVRINNFARAGQNSLLIKFASPINRILPSMKNIPYQLPASNDQGEKTSPYTRKAPYQFGWDWGPRYVTCGIWRPVYLEIWDKARIENVFVRTKELDTEEHKSALLQLNLEIEASEAGEFQLTYGRITAATTEGYKKLNLLKGLNTISVELEINKPNLWWPRGQGEQNLNKMIVVISGKDKALHSQITSFGIRKVELLQIKDDQGESFTIAINGRPIFAKGANWIPADIFPSRMTPGKYSHLLQSCADANFNMLRVWGGGIYEDKKFYGLCDELGIMVWQDFMFACSMYPGDEAFLENVRAEAVDNIKRLRNHPSIVLWCGNNENETAWFHWGWQKALPEKVWDDYLRLFHNILPNAVALYDPGKPYWPSSPSSNLIADAGAENIGDQHYWGVWHGEEPFEEYRKHTPRFSSEYGFQSFPMINTVNSYTLPEDHDIESPVMKAHQKHPRGNSLIKKYMDWYYPEPRDFESFLYMSQILQAEGIKVAAEHLISNMPWCMGSLYWQTNDCWPVASWSGIDYFGRWKALQYYAKRFYADLLIVAKWDKYKGVALEAVWTGDYRDEGGEFPQLSGKVVVMDTSGKVLASAKVAGKAATGQGSLELEVNHLAEINSALWENKNALFYVNISSKGGKVAAEQYLFPVSFKELKLEKATISHEIREEGESIIITVKTDRPAFNVYLELEGVEGNFDDNFFHLMPGKAREVVFKAGNRGELKRSAARRLKVISLIDAIK